MKHSQADRFVQMEILKTFVQKIHWENPDGNRGKTQQRQTQSLDTNKQSLVFLVSSEHWLWWEGKTFLALRALALEDWSKLGLGIVMRSTPAWPQPYTHSLEMVRNDTAHLIGGSLDCPWRWRGRSQHCSSSVVGRPPPSGPRCCRETLRQLLRMAQPKVLRRVVM